MCVGGGFRRGLPKRTITTYYPERLVDVASLLTYNMKVHCLAGSMWAGLQVLLVFVLSVTSGVRRGVAVLGLRAQGLHQLACDTKPIKPTFFA